MGAGLSRAQSRAGGAAAAAAVASAGGQRERPAGAVAPRSGMSPPATHQYLEEPEDVEHEERGRHAVDEPARQRGDLRGGDHSGGSFCLAPMCGAAPAAGEPARERKSAGAGSAPINNCGSSAHAPARTCAGGRPSRPHNKHVLEPPTLLKTAHTHQRELVQVGGHVGKEPEEEQHARRHPAAGNRPVQQRGERVDGVRAPAARRAARAPPSIQLRAGTAMR